MGRVETGLLAHCEERVATGALAAFQLAEHQPHERSDLTDHPWFGDRRADLRHPTHHRLRPRMGISRSAESMPFCSGITAVFGPTSGRIFSPADFQRPTA